MAYIEDHDKFCTVCHGSRVLPDTSRDKYGYSARSYSKCWACAPAVTETVTLGPDAAIDAALAQMGMTRAQWSEDRFKEYHGEDF